MSEEVEGLDKCEGINKEYLDCMQCKNQFDEDDRQPIVLPCLHTVCSSCVNNGIEESQLSCPICSRKYEVPDSSPDAFIVDYTRLDIVNFVNTFHQGKDISCENCEGSKIADYRCQDCETFLCTPCRKSHTNIRRRKHHKIIAIADIKDVSDFKQEMLCTIPGHKDKPLDIYCAGEACKKAVCSMCWMEDHSGNDHIRKDITNQFEEEKNLLLTKADVVNEKFGNLSRLQEKLNDETDDVSRQTIKAELEITSFFNRCIHLMEKRKESLLEKLNTMSEKKLEDLRNQKVDLASRKGMLSHGSSFLGQACLSQNPAAFLTLTSTIYKHLEELNTLEFETEANIHRELTFFIEGKGACFKEKVKTLGDVLSSDAYPDTSNLSIPNSMFRYLSKTFKVTLRDSNSKPVDESAHVSLLVNEESSGKRARINFKEIGEGVYEADCTFKNCGTYSLKLLVNGVPFKDLPEMECVEHKTDSIENGDKYEEEEAFFCNGEECFETEDECGSSDAYMEDDDDDDFGSEYQESDESNSFIVQGFPNGTPPNRIEDYFNEMLVSGKDKVCEVQMDEDEGWCKVVFSNTDVLKRFSGRRLKFEDHDLTIKMHNSEIPSPVKIANLNMNKIKFLLGSPLSKEVLDERLQQLDAKIQWSSSIHDESSLIIECCLDPYMNNFKKKAHTWRRCVERAVQQFLETLYVTEEKIKEDEWNFLEKRVREIRVTNDKRVLIDEDKTRFYIVIVGYKIPFIDATNKVRLFTADVIVSERLEEFEIHLLSNGKVLDDICKDFKGMKIIPKGDRNIIEFSGTAGIVAVAKQQMAEALQKVEEVPISGFSPDKIAFLQTPVVKLELDNLLKENGILGAWKVKNDNTLVMYSLTKTSAQSAAHLVEDSVVEVSIDVETQPDNKEWNKEVEHMKKKKGGHVNIVTTENNKVVIFAIPKNNAKAIEEHVKIFHKYPDKKVRGTTHFSTKTGQTITTIVGDITDLDNDVIVCSSSRSLELSCGVGHDLVIKGGVEIQKECKDYLAKKPNKQLDVDEVFCSSAGKLRGKMVAHVGGKSWSNDHEKEKKSLVRVVQEAMRKTQEKKFTSFAIPALYTGHSGFPVKEITEWIVEAIDNFLESHGKQTSLENIYLCDIKKTTVDSFVTALRKYYSLTYERE